MVSAEDAKNIILSSIHPLTSEEVTIHESAGRVLWQDVVAREDVPPFDTSSMDGFALKVSPMRGEEMLPLKRTVIGEVKAGSVYDGDVRVTTAVRIMTGAPLPAGANAVVEQEGATVEGNKMTVPNAVEPGRNLRARGEDVTKGQVMFRKGTRLGGAHLGVLAAQGITRIVVARKPRVAVLTAGDELVDPEESPPPGKIRDSNRFVLATLIREAGAEPVMLPTPKDTEEELESALREALSCDALVTSGGVSVGKYDLILTSLKRVGFDMKFAGVNIKPGKPLAFGVSAESPHVPVFALPGNPVSTYVTFLQFVRPALAVMMGLDPSGHVRKVIATVAHPITKDDTKRHYMRGIMLRNGVSVTVRTTGTQSSGALTSLTTANCLIIVPEDVQVLEPGASVEVELLP